MQNIIDNVRKNVITIENGFKPMEEIAKTIFQTSSTEKSNSIACELYLAEEYQVRMVAAFYLDTCLL